MPSTKGSGTQNYPLCLLAIFRAWDQVAMAGMLESVWQRVVLLALFAVAHAGVTAHYTQPITSDFSLESTGQGHHRD